MAMQPMSGTHEVAPNMYARNAAFLIIGVVVMTIAVTVGGAAIGNITGSSSTSVIIGLVIGFVLGAGGSILIFWTWLRGYRPASVDFGTGILSGPAGDIPLRSIDKAMVIPAQRPLVGVYGADLVLGAGDKEAARLFLQGTRLRKVRRDNVEVVAEVLRRSSAPTTPDTIEGLVVADLLEAPSWHRFPPPNSPERAARNILMTPIVPTPPRKGMATVASNLGVPADVIAGTIQADPDAVQRYCAALAAAGVQVEVLQGSDDSGELAPDIQLEATKALAVLTGQPVEAVTVEQAPELSARLAAIVNPLGMAEAVDVLKGLDPERREKILAGDVGMKAIWEARNLRP
ncbi:hypothetical protein CGZ92_03280 [Parenemella sanctibonifatiensis]|uniref:Uncharacterized protein n=2 Tax=Parenemella sanctibonifatiensis TaxID=2016505 RepID=A0A255EAZ1_9ACTN|nr:hypothetical protein CGZ92_03280 [Parenemella sanctibonifatiensis]